MKDLISGLIWLAVGVWIWFYSAGFPSLEQGYPGPSLFPRVIAIGLALSGMALAVKAVLKRESLRDALRAGRTAFAGVAGRRWARLGAGAAAVLVFPWVLPLAGPIPSLAFICAAFGLLLGVRLRVAIPTAIVSGAVIYFLFSQLLGVPL